ncbi:hypothetical protein LAUMK7_01469 [Mycobacterium kansasii]|nr:hypothetical protein LAUMK22_00842 [Mycobacterium kansasii]VAZ72711.1 hypothetical protein LAUMK7_01469 [Mycobacterium kansasii]
MAVAVGWPRAEWGAAPAVVCPAAETVAAESVVAAPAVAALVAPRAAACSPAALTYAAPTPASTPANAAESASAPISTTADTVGAAGHPGTQPCRQNRLRHRRSPATAGTTANTISWDFTPCAQNKRLAMILNLAALCAPAVAGWRRYSRLSRDSTNRSTRSHSRTALA